MSIPELTNVRTSGRINPSPTMGYKFYPCKLRVMEHGFGGFSRISQIGSWENVLTFISQ
ncbi:MAG: hypothetical protein FWG87_04650 [Defluviitaleaceae bacterium]|nr:hypothetical protein [Defluviitaleaceae bacterium]